MISEGLIKYMNAKINRILSLLNRKPAQFKNWEIKEDGEDLVFYYKDREIARFFVNEKNEPDFQVGVKK